MSNISAKLDRVLIYLLKEVDVTRLHLKQELDYLLFCALSCGQALALHFYGQDQPLFISPDIFRWLGEDENRGEVFL